MARSQSKPKTKNQETKKLTFGIKKSDQCICYFCVTCWFFGLLVWGWDPNAISECVRACTDCLLGIPWRITRLCVFIFCQISKGSHSSKRFLSTFLSVYWRKLRRRGFHIFQSSNVRRMARSQSKPKATTQKPKNLHSAEKKQKKLTQCICYFCVTCWFFGLLVWGWDPNAISEFVRACTDCLLGIPWRNTRLCVFIFCQISKRVVTVLSAF